MSGNSNLAVMEVGELLQLQRGYDLPLTKMESGNVPVAGSNGIIGYHNVSLCEPPCITVGRSGSVGKVHYYNIPVWPHNTSLFVSDFKGNDPHYLYYLLKLINFDQCCGASVVPSLNRNLVYPLKVSCFRDVASQRKIGKFLSSIDRMIELSRKRIENLEKLAKEIYDYWFVQFDFPDKRGKPYKNSGGKMVYNAELKREIPAGWIVKRFGDLVSINEGQVNPQKMGDRQLEHYSIPAYDDSRYPVMEKASSILSNKFKVTAEAFLVSKLNPQFKRLWDPVCVTADAVCSTEFIVCQSKDEINKPFNYGVADSEAFQIYMRQRSSSSTGSRKRLDPKDILEFKLAMPLDDGLLDKFNKLAGDCLAMIKESRKGIHELTQLREFLLPLLMNGQAKMR